MSSMSFPKYLICLLVFLSGCSAYCPVVICPGFGNDMVDYDTPLGQSSEVGLRSVLGRRGFDLDAVSTVPVKRGDWVRVAGGLIDPGFYRGDARPSGPGYGWYVDRLKREVDLAYEAGGGEERVMLIGHSAGGWLARAAMSDGTWRTEEDGTVVKTSDRVRCLVTLGAIHKVPEDASTCVTRGCLKYTDESYPGAFLGKDGIKYITVGGAAVTGDNRKEQDLASEADELYAVRGEGSAARVAFTSYLAVSGDGNRIGDGVVPLEWTKLEGATNIQLEGVVHSINEAGTTIPTDQWYGSEGVIDRWMPTVLEMTQLKKGPMRMLSPLAPLQESLSKLLKEVTKQ